MPKRALISVYDKSGILEFARFLAAEGWELVSTGGTAAYLRENALPVTDVSQLTGFPECLDGRVKTLHPAIHAGLLARRNDAAHTETLFKLGLAAIDLAAVNLYPFFEKADGKLPLAETIEFIDIGGPSMLRSAAKNFADVIALCDTADYPVIMEEMRRGGVSIETRRKLAGKVFNLTSAYDAAVSNYLLGEEGFFDAPFLTMPLKKAPAALFPPLRYGENPHQRAAFYINEGAVAPCPPGSGGRRGAFSAMEQLGGKALGYNNLRDLDLAWKAAASFNDFRDKDNKVCAVAVKHITPCGIALGDTALSAFQKARDCDPVSIFGGIIAVNSKVDGDCARELAKIFLEIVIAPEWTVEALEILRVKKDLRIIKAALPPSSAFELLSVDGGVLIQERDTAPDEKWELVTKLSPDERDIPDMRFAMRAAAWMRSNAIVIANNLTTTGIGSGETNRVSACELALKRAAKTAPDARVMASDAFLPFADCVALAAKAGIKSIIQPGGSIRDGESIAACDKLGVAMVFTGTRRFKH